MKFLTFAKDCISDHLIGACLSHPSDSLAGAEVSPNAVGKMIARPSIDGEDYSYIHTFLTFFFIYLFIFFLYTTHVINKALWMTRIPSFFKVVENAV